MITIELSHDEGFWDQDGGVQLTPGERTVLKLGNGHRPGDVNGTPHEGKPHETATPHAVEEMTLQSVWALCHQCCQNIYK
jgi:hypothetical protein